MSGYMKYIFLRSINRDKDNKEALKTKLKELILKLIYILSTFFIQLKDIVYLPFFSFY